MKFGEELRGRRTLLLRSHFEHYQNQSREIYLRHREHSFLYANRHDYWDFVRVIHRSIFVNREENHWRLFCLLRNKPIHLLRECIFQLLLHLLWHLWMISSLPWVFHSPFPFHQIMKKLVLKNKINCLRWKDRKSNNHRPIVRYLISLSDILILPIRALNYWYSILEIFFFHSSSHTMDYYDQFFHPNCRDNHLYSTIGEKEMKWTCWPTCHHGDEIKISRRKTR